MAFVRSAFDAASGVLADQWKDFYTVPLGLKPTAALFPAVRRGTDLGRGVNVGGSLDVITNGSRFIVPPGYALVLMESGDFTGLITEAGAYEWYSYAPDSQSVFLGGDPVSLLVKASWERFQFGGRPTAQQRAFYVSLKEVPNNKFGTSSAVFWDDTYMNAQVGAVARGTYTLRIADPILFMQNLVPAKYLQNFAIFDFTDLYNDAAEQLFNEVVGSLSAALSRYTNDPAKENRITRIQQDTVGFAQSLSAAVEQNYRWRSQRGLEIVNAAILSIEYDSASNELLKTVQRADALSGRRGNSNLQASTAAGIQAAGQNAGAGGIIGLGIAAHSAGIGALQQPVPAASTEGALDEDVVKLQKFKQLLDAGLITQADYDAAKMKVLGL